MSWDFDYKRAWDEWAKPEYDKLPVEVHKLVAEIHERCADEGQNSSLGMDWPAHWPELRRRLKALPKKILARAIQVVYCYGHWGYQTLEKNYIQQHGTYWKFEMYGKNAWLEKYPGEDYKQVYKMPDTKPRFYTHVEGTEFDCEELTERYRPLITDPLEIVKVDHCNFRPHLFVIGSQHFPKDGGMYIDPHQAPCAMHGCGLSYEDHVSDKVLFVKLIRNCKNKTVAAVLFPIKQLMIEHKIDGVAFVENEFKIKDNAK